MDINKILAHEIAKGIMNLHIEGDYDSVAKSTGYNYPSIGVSQWEGQRADSLLMQIPGGKEFVGRNYENILASGEMPELKKVLSSKEGKAAQMLQLEKDCALYVKELQQIPTLDDTRCLIYAGMWCPTSTRVVKVFLTNRYKQGYNLRSLKTMYQLFGGQYWKAADVGEMYKAGYRNRALLTFKYLQHRDLTNTYGIPPYGEAGNGK